MSINEVMVRDCCHTNHRLARDQREELVLGQGLCADRTLG
jgi:hypothetical protein